MTPDDVDLSNRTATLTSRKGRGDLKPRKIPLTDDLYAFMAEQMKMVKAKGYALVFVDETGGMINAGRLSTMIIRISKKVGLPGMNLHSLRHTLATQLVRQNTNIRKVQKLLGHSNLNTTMRYLQDDVEDMRADLETLENTNQLGISRAAKGQLEDK